MAETSETTETVETTRATTAAASPSDSGSGTTPTDAALGDAGKRALDTERTARDAAEKEAKRLQGILDKQATEKRKADEDAAAQRGEFQELATKREGERDAAIAERDTLSAERDQLRAFFDGQVASALKTLPDALKDFDPGPDAPFAARKDWLEKAQKRAGDMARETTRGNGHDPRAAGTGGKPTAADEQRALAARGTYSM